MEQSRFSDCMISCSCRTYFNLFFFVEFFQIYSIAVRPLRECLQNLNHVFRFFSPRKCEALCFSFPFFFFVTPPLPSFKQFLPPSSLAALPLCGAVLLVVFPYFKRTRSVSFRPPPHVLAVAAQRTPLYCPYLSICQTKYRSA